MLPDWPRILVPVVLTAQGLLVYFAAGRENLPAAPVLSGFPAEFSAWSQLRDDPLEPELVNDLHADQLLNRIYVNRPRERWQVYSSPGFSPNAAAKANRIRPKYVCLVPDGCLKQPGK